MTLYEELKTKADLCRKAARNTEGFMREVWIEKANKLEIRIANMPLNVAAQKIK